MKKFICLIGIFLLFFSALSARQPAPAAERNAADTAVYTPRKGWPKADKRFYFDLRGGYGFKMGSGYTGFLRFDEFRTCMPFEIEKERKEIKRTLGRGWQGSLSFGYQFNRYMAIEVGIGYIKSGFSASQLFPCDTSGHIVMSDNMERLWSDTAILTNWTTIKIANDFDSHIGNLSVSLRVSPGFRRWDPYIKMGLNLMVGMVTHNIKTELGNLYAWQQNEYGYWNVATNENWGGFGRSGHERLVTTSVGFTAAFGINCRFTPTVSMFAEWQFTLMSSVAYRDHWIGVGNGYGNEAYSHVLDNAVMRKYYNGESSVRSDFVLPFSNTGLNIGFKFAF